MKNKDNYVNYHIENASHFKIMGNNTKRDAHVRAAALAINADDEKGASLYKQFAVSSKVLPPFEL